MFKKLPHPLTLVMLILAFAALATWLIPAGKYDTLGYVQGSKTFTYAHLQNSRLLPFAQHTLDNLNIHIPLQSFRQGGIHKPVSVPGTYHRLSANHQGPLNVAEAPLKGIYDTVDIMLFLMMIGSFIHVFNATGAMESGLNHLSLKMKGREGWLIIILTFLLSFGGASYGMSEEALALYPVMIPLFLAAGYDLMVPLAINFGGTQLGTLASFSNPFATIIASNTVGISWTDGLYGRMLMFLLSTALYVWYILHYAKKVRRNPQHSLVYRFDGIVNHAADHVKSTAIAPLTAKVKLLLLIFLFTFLIMIGGVVFLHWWLLEMAVTFLISSVLVAVLQGMKEKQFVQHFIKGAESMLGVTFIIGAARGITIILNNGNISDTILFYAAHVISPLPPSAFIVFLLVLYLVFSLFIASTSGMAVLTLPILGSLALMIGIPGREIVNSYLYGMGIMYFISPTAFILPNLAIVGVSLKTWWKFIWPFLLILFVLCSIFLIIGIHL